MVLVGKKAPNFKAKAVINGGEILVRRAQSPSPGGDDTPEELERVRAIWSSN